MPRPALVKARLEDSERWSGDGFWSKTRRASGQKPDFESPFYSGGTMMCPDNRAIDHLNAGIADAFSERFEHKIPQPAHRPAPVLAVYQVPISHFLGQIAPGRTGPGDPEYRLKRTPMVTWRAPSQRTCLIPTALTVDRCLSSRAPAWGRGDPCVDGPTIASIF